MILGVSSFKPESPYIILQKDIEKTKIESKHFKERALNFPEGDICTSTTMGYFRKIVCQKIRSQRD